MTEAQQKTLDAIGSLTWQRHGRQYDLFAVKTDDNCLRYDVVEIDKPNKKLGEWMIWADGYISRSDRANDLMRRKIEARNRNLRTQMIRGMR